MNINQFLFYRNSKSQFILIVILAIFIQSVLTANVTMYVKSDSPSGGDGSQQKPFSDLYFAMNTIASVVSKQDGMKKNNINGDDVVIYLDSDSQNIYNMFDPTKSPLTYLVSSPSSVSFNAYSSKGQAILHRPVIRVQDFLQVQNTSFQMQQCQLNLIITDQQKSLPDINKQKCQIDLIGSIPHISQVTFQIIDESSGGYIPSSIKINKVIKKQKQQGVSSSKNVYLSRSFLCTHQQQVDNNKQTNRLLMFEEQKQSEKIQLNQQKFKNNQQEFNNQNESQEIKLSKSRRALQDEIKDKKNATSACAFNQIEIIDSAIKVESSQMLSVWEGNLIDLNFASNDIFGKETCELSDIMVRNVTLCSDIGGSIISLNYYGSKEADFEKNVVKNLTVDNCHLIMVDIFDLNLQSSEMKLCKFENFALTNTYMDSSVGIDQSAFIKIGIKETTQSTKRELFLVNHQLKNNTFKNARFFSVEPQYSDQAVYTYLDNLMMDSNKVISSNSDDIQQFSNATQISIYNSSIYNNHFEQIVVFDSQFNLVIDDIQIINNYVYNNSFTNAQFYSAEMNEQTSVNITNNTFFYNYQTINPSLTLSAINLIQSAMFNLVGKASEFFFIDNHIKVGQPLDPTKNCTCYTEQFAHFVQVESIEQVSIKNLIYEDPCQNKEYNLRKLEPNAIRKGTHKNEINIRNSIQEKRGGFLQVQGFNIFMMENTVFKNILTSCPLVSLQDEQFITSSQKRTIFLNVTLTHNTLVLINESSLLYFNYRDDHSVNFEKNNFENNILILAMDRVIGYTAPCISFKGYNSIFNMDQNTFTKTAIRFEVFSLSMGGNALIAALNITITNSIFKDSCQNIIDTSVNFSPFDNQCLKNTNDIDESFLRFSDGGALNLFGTNQITIQNSVFQNNEAKRGGAIFMSGQVENISITQNNFTSNNAIEGGAIYSEQVKVVHNNSALKYGVVIDSFLFFQYFIMDDCIFVNNYIRQSGSDNTYMVKIEKLGNCEVKITNVKFFGNNSLKFAGDYFQIFHSNLKQSRSNRDVITKQGEVKPILFQKCFFYIAGQQSSLTSKYYPQAITIMSRKIDNNPIKTPLILDSITFSGENKMSIFQRFFQNNAHNALLKQLFSNVYEKEIKYSSQAIYANNADLIMTNVNIMNILHSNGCVTIKNSYLHISDSLFEMNYKANRAYNASQLVITSQQPEKHRSLLERVTFKGYIPDQGDLQYDSQMISLNNIQNVDIKNCSFINASADYGAAIQIQERTQNVNIQDCQFLNNWSRYNGGSIYVEKDCYSLSVFRSTFNNSKSYYGFGGALVLNKMNNNFNITNNKFFQNTAVFGNSIAVLSFDHDSLKAVLANNYYEQNLTLYTDLIVQYAEFVKQNQAMLISNGIVIYDWQQVIPSSEICLNFTMNYRSFSYEWDIEQKTIYNYSESNSSLDKISISDFQQQRKYYQNLLNNFNLAALNESQKNQISSQLNYATQVEYNLTSEGQDSIYTPIKPNLQATFSSQYDFTNDILSINNDQLVVSDDRGYLQTVAVGVNNNVRFLHYYDLLEKLTQYGLVDSNKNATYDLLYSDSNSLSSIVPNYKFFNKTTYQPYLMGVGLSECNSGFSFDSTNRKCDYCQQGVYSLDPQGYKPCLPCEQNSVCLGGYEIEVNEGFWRSSIYNSEVLQCNKNPYNCLKTDDANEPYKCEEGYTGPLCEACDNENRYFTNGDGRCYLCEDSWVGKKFIFFLYECFYIYTTAFANTLFATQGHECHALNVRRLNKVYVRIIQTYFQIMSLIISQYSMVGEQFFQFFNQIFQLIGFPVDSVNYNYECWLYQKLGPNNEYYAYYASFISLSEPLFKILVVFFVWLIKRAFRIEAIKNRYFIISITSIILIEQLGVIKILLGSFKCINVNDGSYMERNPNISCQSSIYNTFTNFIFIPMMILWAGGFTLLLFFYIFKNKKNLEKKQMKLFFGFYYMCFRQKYFYWDIIIYLMKLLLLILNYFVLNSGKLRFTCTTLILLGYCLAIKIYKPYTLDRQNKCDQILFYNLIFTMFICYNIDNSNSSSLNLLFIILLSISNLLFIGYISWRMFYIVRYFFKKFKNTTTNNENDPKKSFKRQIKDKDEESEDEEQKNYLMQAEMEYNHLEIAINNNKEEVIFKLEEEDDELQVVNQKGIQIPHRKLETEQIRQRYEYHQYLKSLVDHNQQQPVNLENYQNVYTDDENDDSILHNPHYLSQIPQNSKSSFAFQKLGKQQSSGSIAAPPGNKHTFKSFNQPLGSHDFGKKKKSILKSQIGERTKTNSNQNIQSILINQNSNNNLNNKESVGGQRNAFRNFENQNSLNSASSQSNIANLKKSFMHHIKKSFIQRQYSGRSMLNNQNNYNHSQYYQNQHRQDDDYIDDLQDEGYEQEQSSFHYQNKPNKWGKQSIFAEDEVRQRNIVPNKNQLFQDQQSDYQDESNNQNSFFINNESNILGSNIKVNPVNNNLSNRKNTNVGSKFNPLTTRPPSTSVINQGNNALYSTQNEIDPKLLQVKTSLSQDDSMVFGQNNNRYDSDNFYLQSQSYQQEEEEDEESSDDNKKKNKK